MKLKDTKLKHINLFHVYIVIMNYQKEEVRKQSHLSSHQKNKISRNKPTQGGKRPILRKLLRN